MRFFSFFSLTMRGIIVSAIFCWLLGYGWWNARLSHRTVLLFVALYVAGMIGFPYLALSRWAFVAWIAVLNVVLALLVFYQAELRD